MDCFFNTLLMFLYKISQFLGHWIGRSHLLIKRDVIRNQLEHEDNFKIYFDDTHAKKKYIKPHYLLFIKI